MTTLAVEARGLTFDVRVAGPDDGEPVLLLHGFPQTSWAWRHQMEALAAAGYRAIAPDQRGYSPGARPDDHDAYATHELVADVLAFADAFGAPRFHLVGHDWGGALAWQVAGRHGDRLWSVTAVSTPHPAAFRASILHGEQKERSAYMLAFRAPGAEDLFLADDAAGLRMLYDATGVGPDDAAVYVAALTQPGACTGALNWYRSADITLVAGLRDITVPTLYVWSTDDPALGREAAEATADHVAGPYRFEVLEGVGHFIPETAPDALNALLLEHLRAHGPGT